MNKKELELHKREIPFKVSRESLDRMNKELIRRWNERVNDDDIVIFNGDFCFKSGANRGEGEPIKAEYWINQLKGNKIFIRGNHDCFFEDVELLTKEGWKKYNEVKKGELIPTINLKKQVIEYKPIRQIFIYKIDEELYGYKINKKNSKDIKNSIFFTDNHKHLILDYKTQTKARLVESQFIWGKKSPLILVNAFGEKKKDYRIDDKLIKLYAWLVGDGSWNKTRAYIYQSKPKYIREISSLLKNLNIKYKISTRQRYTTTICGKTLQKKPLPSSTFKIERTELKTLERYFKLEERYKLSENLGKLSNNQVYTFFLELTKADGTKNKAGTLIIWGRKEFLDQLQALAITHGLKSNLIKWNENTYYLTVSYKIKNSFSPKYIYNKIIERKKGIVWDVNVENHIIFIRQNGYPLITGNSNNSLKTNILNLVIEIAKKKIFIVHNPEHFNPAYKINFVAHVHDNWLFQWKKDSLLINIGVDQWDYYPVRWEDIVQGMIKKSGINLYKI